MEVLIFDGDDDRMDLCCSWGVAKVKLSWEGSSDHSWPRICQSHSSTISEIQNEKEKFLHRDSHRFWHPNAMMKEGKRKWRSASGTWGRHAKVI